jgi:hypothetical protein
MSDFFSLLGNLFGFNAGGFSGGFSQPTQADLGYNQFLSYLQPKQQPSQAAAPPAYQMPHDIGEAVMAPFASSSTSYTGPPAYHKQGIPTVRHDAPAAPQAPAVVAPLETPTPSLGLAEQSRKDAAPTIQTPWTTRDQIQTPWPAEAAPTALEPAYPAPTSVPAEYGSPMKLGVGLPTGNQFERIEGTPFSVPKRVAEAVANTYDGPTYKPANAADAFTSKDLNIAYAATPGSEFGKKASANAQPFNSLVFHHTSDKRSPAEQIAYSQKVDAGRGGQFGYHFYVDPAGNVIQAAPLSKRTNHLHPTAPTRSHTDVQSTNSIGISLMGDGKNPTPAQLASAEKLGRELQKSLNIDPQRIFGHGEVEGNRESYEGRGLAERLRKDPTLTVTKTSTDHAPTLTAYSPQKGGDKMEGGYAAARRGPDGKAVVRTLADYSAGRSEYVTLAGDKSEFGKEYVIPEITYTNSEGKNVTLKNVRGVVHDTGSAFKGKGDKRFDIPVDLDLASEHLDKQPFSHKAVNFIPKAVK